jgi:hypothetical protein
MINEALDDFESGVYYSYRASSSHEALVSSELYHVLIYEYDVKLHH